MDPPPSVENNSGGTLENNSSVENNSGGTLENKCSAENNSGGTLENNSGGTLENEQLVLIHQNPIYLFCICYSLSIVPYFEHENGIT